MADGNGEGSQPPPLTASQQENALLRQELNQQLPPPTQSQPLSSESGANPHVDVYPHNPVPEYQHQPFPPNPQVHDENPGLETNAPSSSQQSWPPLESVPFVPGQADGRHRQDVFAGGGGYGGDVAPPTPVAPQPSGSPLDSLPHVPNGGTTEGAFRDTQPVAASRPPTVSSPYAPPQHQASQVPSPAAPQQSQSPPPPAPPPPLPPPPTRTPEQKRQHRAALQRQLQMSQGLEFVQLGLRHYDAAQGFVFENYRPQAIHVSEGDRLAECLQSSPCTLVTRDVCSCRGEPALLLAEVLNVGGEGGKPFGIGVLPQEPFGCLFGSVGGLGSIGLIADEHCGYIVNNGEISEETEGIRNGDIIGIKIGRGEGEFLINNEVVFMWGVQGPDRRLAFTFQSPGQKCRLLSPNDPIQVPSVSDYDEAVGFHFKTTSALATFEGDRCATATTNTYCTIVTKETIAVTDTGKFLVEVLNAGGDSGEPFIFGIMAGPTGPAASNLLGGAGFKGSVGLRAFTIDGGGLFRDGHCHTSTPGINNGDIVGVSFKKGHVTFLINGNAVAEMGIQGPRRRFGVSFQCPRQACRLLSPDECRTSKVPADYNEVEGFHFDTTSPAADFDDDPYYALSTGSGSIVTAETIEVSAKGKFFLMVLNAGGSSDKPFTFGILGGARPPPGSILGDSECQGSVGLRVTWAGGEFFENGRVFATTERGIKDGDCIGINFDKGNVVFLIDGKVVGQIGIEGGRRRFGVSFQCPGQACVLLAPDECPDYQVPGEYIQSSGFHFDTNSTAATFETNALARSTTTSPSTIVTAETIEVNDCGRFLVEVLNAGGDSGRPFVFGIMGLADDSAEHCLLGAGNFRGSVGLRASGNGGSLVKDGESFLSIACGIATGDVVGIAFEKGHLTFLVNGRGVGEMGIEGGRRRFGVSFQSPGQACRILSPEECRVHKVFQPQPYSPSIGFSWDESVAASTPGGEPLVTIEGGRYIYSHSANPMTVVTHQLVFAETDSAKFFVLVMNAGGDQGKPFTFGITGPPITGADRYLLGDSNFHGTMGVRAGVDNGEVVHRGNVDCLTLGVKDGNVVGCTFNKGHVAFVINGEVVFQVRISYACRFGVSFQSPGQECMLLPPDECDGCQVETFEMVPYKSQVGFSFHPNPLTDAYDSNRRLMSKLNAPTTVFTEQYVDTEKAEGKIVFEVLDAGSDDSVFAFGMMAATPYGYQKHLIGDLGFSSAQGVQANGSDGQVKKEGEPVFSLPVPGIRTGDILVVAFCRGAMHFLVNSRLVHIFEARGHFRFGVSFTRSGQACRIITEDAIPQPPQPQVPAAAAVLSSSSSPFEFEPLPAGPADQKKSEGRRRLAKRFKTAPNISLADAVKVSNVPDVDRQAEQALEKAAEKLKALKEAASQKPDDKTLKKTASLEHDEAAAIYLYTMENKASPDDSFYNQLNKALRELPDATDEVQKQTHARFDLFLQLMVSGLDKLERYSEIVFRGIDVKMDLKAGQMIRWNQFSSTSKKLDVLEDFLGETGAGMVFYIKPRTAVCISGLSRFDDEEEVLLLPDTHLEVKSFLQLKNGTTIVHVEETD